MGLSYNPQALSVSELNEYARKRLASDPLLRSLEVTGEISGYKHHYTGHRYFYLKDEGARVQCVMFRQQATGLEFQPQDGMRVTVQASASIFPRDGTFQLYVSAMRQAGKGDLAAQFERLKGKLQAEGLFDPARKREIPTVPRCIGVATSLTGAAVRDIIHVARRRNPNIGIVVSPCAVQGTGAAQDIVRAIERLNARGGCDVLLVGRGGGSIEELWAFNEEIVARAIAASRIPVISCVGHEIDFTIADFVADLRAPTPSAAAELAVPALTELERAVRHELRRLRVALENGQKLRHAQLEKDCASQVFRDPARLILEKRRETLDALTRRMTPLLPQRLERCRQQVLSLSASLRALNPDSVLERGYAIVRQDGRIVDDAAGANIDTPIRVCFANGSLEADIRSIQRGDEGNG